VIYKSLAAVMCLIAMYVFDGVTVVWLMIVIRGEVNGVKINRISIR
jgi:hypothetical protein